MELATADKGGFEMEDKESSLTFTMSEDGTSNHVEVCRFFVKDGRLDVIIPPGIELTETARNLIYCVSEILRDKRQLDFRMFMAMPTLTRN